MLTRETATNLRIRAFTHNVSLERNKSFVLRGLERLPRIESCIRIHIAVKIDGPDKVEESNRDKANCQRASCTSRCADQHPVTFLIIHLQFVDIARGGELDFRLHVDGSIKLVVEMVDSRREGLKMMDKKPRVPWTRLIAPHY